MTAAAGDAGLIALTAPTGNIGRHLTALLSEAQRPARLLARLGTSLPVSGPLSVTPADLDDPASLAPALSGVDHLFLLSPGPDTPSQDAAAIAAAVEAGVSHLVLLSSLGVEADGIGGGAAHAPGEQVLRDSGLPWTVLRPSEFMTNTLAWLPEARGNGTLSLPTGSGRVTYIDPYDIAAVAFTCLTQPGHQGATYRLAGPEALSAADLADRLGTALGRPVTHRADATVEDFRQFAFTAGLPPAMIDGLAAYYPAAADDRMNLPSDDVATVTGRPATPYLDFLRRTLAAQPH